jgi:hypothetical protein
MWNQIWNIFYDLNQGLRLVRFMKKSRGNKSRATVPLISNGMGPLFHVCQIITNGVFILVSCDHFLRSPSIFSHSVPPLTVHRLLSCTVRCTLCMYTTSYTHNSARWCTVPLLGSLQPPSDNFILLLRGILEYRDSQHSGAEKRK